MHFLATGRIGIPREPDGGCILAIVLMQQLSHICFASGRDP